MVLTNVDTYLKIAREALAGAEAVSRANRRPAPGGGEIVTYDPERRSFKLSLTAIVFAGVYLEAFLFIEGTKRLGSSYPEREPYEAKLKALGLFDLDLLAACSRFRQARNDLVHEKAARSSEPLEFRVAQEEAIHAVAFVEQVMRLVQAPQPEEET